MQTPPVTPELKTLCIPNRLNLLLVGLISVLAVALPWLASRFDSWPIQVAIGILFSYAMLTNYALLHDATHDALQSTRRANYWCGFATGLWFPVPFSMIHYTHRSHHRFNRTDNEMFDQYYPTDNRLLKYLQWYSILCGLFWPLVPFGAILIAITPNRTRSALLSRANPARGLAYIASIPDTIVRRVRLELVAMIGIYALLIWMLDLHLLSIAICYACFSFNWSTRQYITHAFTEREVIDGAYNLKHNRLMDWVLLHGQLDLNHHRHPDISWYHLPRLSSPHALHHSYISQYFRQWRGPVPAAGPGPAPLLDETLPTDVANDSTSCHSAT